MRQKFLIPLFGCLLIAALLLTACEIPTRPTEICAPGSMPGISPVYPRGSVYGGSISDIIDDLRPSITWSLEEGAECVPGEYLVEVWGVDYDLPGEEAWSVLVSGRTEVEAFPWPTGAPDLLPARTYLVVLTTYGLRDGELVYGGQIPYYFSTGPLCNDVSRLSAPSLFLPPDRSTVDPDGIFALHWSSEMTCWPDDGYSLEISANDDFTDLVYSRSGIILQHEPINPMLSIPWEECEYYYWRVRAEAEGEAGPYSDTRSILIRPGDVICPIELGPVITPLPPVSLRILEAANCRSGPTMDYPVRRVLLQGEQYPVVGRSQDGLTWVIGLVAIDDEITWTPEEIRENGCWVHGDLVEVLGDTSLVQLIDPDPPMLVLPTDTPAPFNCAQYNTNPTACNNNQACWWDSSVPPNGTCKNK